MSGVTENRHRLPVMVGSLGWLLVGHLTAQTFTTLYSFTGGPSGANPWGPTSSGATLYGTTEYGGTVDKGMVFKVNIDGTGLTMLATFSGYDGQYPTAGVTLSGNTLYGTTDSGGNGGYGTVFKVSTNGTGYAMIKFFPPLDNYGYGTNGDGVHPCGLTSAGSRLYGTANTGGMFGSGTVFAMNTDGSGFTNLHSFAATSAYPYRTNSEGANPLAGVMLSGSTLYGTTGLGGSSGNGTVFRVNTDGTDYTVLKHFTGSDGAGPYAVLTLSGNTLYGTTASGGSWSNGVVFKVNTDGTGFTNVHSFTSLVFGTNSDGARPQAALTLSSGTIYGTTRYGGNSGKGTVFTVNADGTGFTNLYSFTATSGPYPPTNSDGSSPFDGLILAGNTLYGTAFDGGPSGKGTVFSLSFPPQLTITPAGTNFVLSWRTNFAGFDYTGYTLQSATYLGSSAIWGTNLPPPVVVNGQLTVTNPISGTQQFFRLSQCAN